MENSSSHTSTVFNKILIPVITTVLGATAIYFLGFNKKGSGSSNRTDMEQMLISKEATVKAWKSFVTSQNIEYKMEKSLMDEFTQKFAEVKKTARSLKDFAPVFSEFQKDLSRERSKTTKDVENIIKDPDIDRDYLSMLNRILDNTKDYDNKLSEFFDGIISLVKSDEEETEKGKKFTAEIQKFEGLEKKMNDRVITEAEDIAKVLSDKYSQAFNLNELDVYADIKKEKEKKPDEPAKNTPTGGPAPVDPANAGGGAEIKTDKPPSVSGGSSSGTYSPDNNKNTVEPTVSLLAGQWETTGSVLELSRNGDMYWTFNTKGYTSGDWKLVNGTIRMNATNPDTKKTTVVMGSISGFSRKSMTLTFTSALAGVYRFEKKEDY